VRRAEQHQKSLLQTALITRPIVFLVGRHAPPAFVDGLSAPNVSAVLGYVKQVLQIP
jgi:hypothetical protein